MLTAHGSGKSLIRGPQGPNKHHPKTPLPFRQRDENATTVLAGKSGLGGARTGGNENILMTKGRGGKQALITPQGQGARAPLGNKTTNAKARVGQAGGVKDGEKTQLKPSMPKPKQKAPEVLPARIEVKHDEGSDVEEPEYAPPPPKPLPYESDLLPKGGLNFEALKGENMLLGFYEHFINPIDENGVSKRDKQFQEEMKAVMNKAVAKNEQDLKELDWGFSDGSQKVLTKKPAAPKVAMAKMTRKIRDPVHQRRPSAISSRRMAMALGSPRTLHNAVARKPIVPRAFPRRPPTSLAHRPKYTKPVSSYKPATSISEAGQAFLRTTAGYGRNNTALSTGRLRSQSQSTPAEHRTKASILRDDDPRPTTTLPRAYNAGFQQNSDDHPSFTSVFDLEEDDGDLPPMKVPLVSDDEDEVFELKLDICAEPSDV